MWARYKVITYFGKLHNLVLVTILICSEKYLIATYERHLNVTLAASSPSSEKANGGLPGLIDGFMESRDRIKPGTLLSVIS